MVLGRFLFTHFWCRLPIKVAKVAGTTGRTRGFQTERSFSMMHDFRQSSEALRLSQVSKMLLELSEKNSAHCSSSEIRNAHLCLFRPDRDRDEKSGRKPSAIAPIAPRTSAKNAKRSTTAIAERSLPSRREIRPKTLSDWWQRSLSSRREIRPKTLGDRRRRWLSDGSHRASKSGQKRYAILTAIAYKFLQG